MMRHYLLSGPITAHSRSVASAAAKARRVAPGGGSLGLPARPSRAFAAAIDLPSVAAAADDYVVAAGHIQKQSA
jgi:hypothetical protein